MIKLVTGVPGSGKTYYCVKIIYDEINNKHSSYKSIYTNINLNFKKLDELKKDFVKSLNLDDLMKRIEEDFVLSEKFKNNDLFDKETGELITDYDSYVRGKLKLFEPYEHSLIILDECHLYFTDKVDQKLLRFLSYHRHFDIDMYLVTQNKSLINRKYLAFIENLIKGVNPSKRFFSKVFGYHIYASYQENKNNFAFREKIKFNEKVANFYNSGSVKINKSFTFKLLLPVFILIFIVFFMYKFLLSKFSSNNSSQTNISSPGENVNLSSKHNFRKNVSSDSESDIYNTDYSNYHFVYKFTCFKQKCISKNIVLQKSFLDNLVLHSYTNILTYYFKSHSVYYVFTNLNLNKFTIGGNNEMDSNSSNHSVF